jgi:formate dehydrogenase beta subunit
VKVCPSGSLYYTPNKTIGIHHEKCIGCKECISACPFNIPRYDKTTDKVYKCDLCYSRIQENLPPACVKSCPTGALSIGPKDEMMKKAYAKVEKLGGDANVYGDKFVDGTHVIYVLQFKPEVYDVLPGDPKVPQSVTLWKNLLKPLSLLAAGGVVGGTVLHYFIHGPHKPHPEHYSKEEKKQGGA